MDEPSNDNDEAITGNPMLMRKRATELRTKAAELKEEVEIWQARIDALLTRAYYLDENAAAFERGED